MSTRARPRLGQLPTRSFAAATPSAWEEFLTFKATVYKDGSTYFAKEADGTTISSGSTYHTVAQAGLDFVRDNGGGTCFHRSGVYEHTGTSSLVVAQGVNLAGEGFNMENGTGGAPTGGTIIRQTSGNPTYVIDMADAWGSRVHNLSVDCNDIASTGIHQSGWQQRVHDVHVHEPLSSGILVTGGEDATGFAYADTHIYDALITGTGNNCKGIYVQAAGSNAASDGNIGPNVRIFGCHGGCIDIETGGWVIDGPMHITGNISVPFGIRAAGQVVISGIYIDSIGSGPSIDITGDRAIISGVKVDFPNFAADNTHSIIRLSAGVQAVSISGMYVSNSTTTTAKFLVDVGANPINRGIKIEGVVAAYTTTSPFATAIVGNGVTTYETSTTEYTYDPIFVIDI